MKLLLSSKRRIEHHYNSTPRQIINDAIGEIENLEVLARLTEGNHMQRVVNCHQNMGKHNILKFCYKYDFSFLKHSNIKYSIFNFGL